MGASPFVVGVLREGYRIRFHGQPPMTLEPQEESTSKNPHKDQLLDQHIQELLAKQAIEVVQGPYYNKGFYSHLFMVPKANGKMRPIIDLKLLNRFVVVPKFKMETVASVWKALIPGNFGFSVDLTDAYFHIPIHPKSRKYLRIYRNGTVYQFRALPFGLSTSPWIFTQVMAELKVMVHNQNILMYLYLDDWLVQVARFQLGLRQSKYLVELCTRLGLLVNLEKSELVPTQDFGFIGARFNLQVSRVFPLDKNIDKVHLIVSTFLQSRYQTAATWQSLLGVLTSQQKFVYLARLFTRPIQWCLMDRWNQRKDNPEQFVQFPNHLRRYLFWWKGQMEDPQGVPLLDPAINIRMFTDASLQGWGAHVQSSTYQGVWTSQEKKLHINVLELRAVRLALCYHDPPEGSVILTSTDNTTVVAFINRQGGTHSRILMEETQLLYDLVMERDWRIQATYIPGRLNVIADQLSRKGQTLPTEWSVHPQAIRQIFKLWFTPNIDLFATRYNTKCQLFVSPVPDDLAIEVDALSMDLEGLEAYAYPPHQILANLLQKYIRTQNCRLIVVAPFWPKQPWFPLLNQLAVREPAGLPLWAKLLRQPLSKRFHPEPQMLNLHAWLLERGTWLNPGVSPRRPLLG